MATDNIMFIPSVVLMVVEAVAFIFLVWSWFDAKKKETMQKKKCPCCGEPIVPYQESCLNCLVYLREVVNDNGKTDICH